MKIKLAALVVLTLAVAVPVLVGAFPGGAFEGKPQFAPASATGAFVWQQDERIQVRFTSVEGPVRFHGKVCVRGRVHSVGAQILDEGDRISVDQDGRCLRFSFMNDRHVDAFHFRTRNARINFDFHMNTDQLPPEQIWIGVEGRHPEDSPFTVQRDQQRDRRLRLQR